MNDLLCSINNQYQQIFSESYLLYMLNWMYMNDTKSSQMVRDDFSSELEVSGELLRDQGEATPDRPLSPAELASVNAGRVEANFKVTLTLEEDAIKQGAVTADEVYNLLYRMMLQSQVSSSDNLNKWH